MTELTINKVADKHTTFADLGIGSWFLYNNIVYVKTRKTEAYCFDSKDNYVFNNDLVIELRSVRVSVFK